MNKVSSRQQRVGSNSATRRGARSARALLRVSLVAALGAAALFPPTAPRAQRSGEKGANVKDVSASRRGAETTVSISGEGAMNRVQTWQDDDGFHVVFPGGKGAPGRLPAGVRAQRVGDSLELVVPTRPGASVRVQPGADRLDLLVEGGLREGEAQPQAQVRRGRTEPKSSTETPERGGVEARRTEDEASRRPASESNSTAPQKEKSEAVSEQAPRPDVSVAAGHTPAAQTGDKSAGEPAPGPDVSLQSQEVGQQPADAVAARTSAGAGLGGLSVFALAGLLLLVGVAIIGCVLFFVRGRRADTPNDGVVKKRAGHLKREELKPSESSEVPPFEPYKGDRRKNNVPVAQDRRRGTEEQGQRFSVSNGTLTAVGAGDKLERRTETRPVSPAMPAVLFGAYRIDQEIGKLVQGLPHSIEVLASRAADDRRAIETSLIKALNAHEAGEDATWRVRRALEDYGFVARQSASLLLSTDTYDRVSAARTLGQIRSESSLPFLLEALYDVEPLVRTEAVASLGALGLPRAIGALIDMARRYPEVPASLLSPALTACSFEVQEWSWVSPTEGGAAASESGREEGRVNGEFAGYEVAARAEQLPEWLEDENLSDALERLESADVEARISAAQSLAQYPVRRSVEALTALLVRDENSAVRAAAVTSLGAVDHESVLAPVLYALADDSREVRAAAARAYSSVNFDRAEAAARLAETADRETLEDLARACVKSGMAAQCISRLASEDRRHAYESFSVLSLMVRGGEVAPLIEAIADHRDTNVRLAAVRLAGLSGDPKLLAGLREVAGRTDLPQSLVAAIAEAVDEGSCVDR